MNRTVASLKEWINPNWGIHRSVPPMEAGLRPNDWMSDATSRLPEKVVDVDAVATRAGTLYYSAGQFVHALNDPSAPVDLGDPVTAIAASPTRLVAAVSGRGLVEIASTGTKMISEDHAVLRCVTDLAFGADDVIFATVGSAVHDVEDWSRSLLEDDSSGSVVIVRNGSAEVVARDLAWPSGVAVDGDSLILALSLAHTIERRPLTAINTSGAELVRNMPVYPGRIEPGPDGFWVAAPYVRNRFTELLIDEPVIRKDMMGSIEQDQWFVPRLGRGNPWTDPLQIGQLRVLGVIKPWAPARSYGLVFHIDRSGRITESHHSRSDRDRHGITGVAVLDGSVVVAARGASDIYQLSTKGRAS
jgi:hypothetical protein